MDIVLIKYLIHNALHKYSRSIYIFIILFERNSYFYYFIYNFDDP